MADRSRFFIDHRAAPSSNDAMDPANTIEHTERPGRHGGILYPLLLVAAIAVIVFSIIGIATMTGLMSSATPRDGTGAKSEAEPKGKPARIEAPRREPAPKAGNPRTAASSAGCGECGVIDAIRAVEVKGQAGGADAVTGNLTRADAVHPVGAGRSREVLTAIGTGAGNPAVHAIERNIHKTVSYLVRVRMDDGTYWTFYEASPPSLKQGQPVRVTNDRVVADG